MPPRKWLNTPWRVCTSDENRLKCDELVTLNYFACIIYYNIFIPTVNDVVAWHMIGMAVDGLAAVDGMDVDGLAVDGIAGVDGVVDVSACSCSCSPFADREKCGWSRCFSRCRILQILIHAGFEAYQTM